MPKPAQRDNEKELWHDADAKFAEADVMGGVTDDIDVMRESSGGLDDDPPDNPVRTTVPMKKMVTGRKG